MPVPTTVLEGRLADDPQVGRFNQNLVELTIVTGRREKDEATGQWVDKQTAFIHCDVWNDQLKNNILNSLRKGMEVIATAEVRQNSWTDKQTGKKRSSINFVVTNIAASLKHATVNVESNSRGGYNGSDQGSYQGRNPYQHQDGGTSYAGATSYGAGGFPSQPAVQQSSASAGDPWSAAPAGDSFGSFGSSDGEPEF